MELKASLFASSSRMLAFWGGCAMVAADVVLHLGGWPAFSVFRRLKSPTEDAPAFAVFKGWD